MDDVRQGTSGRISTSPGIVYMFFHETIQGYKTRKGAKYDIDNLTRCFKNLGFKVQKPYIDNTADEVNLILDDASNGDFEEYQSLVVIIVSHFYKVGQILTKEGKYSENVVIEHFIGNKCKSLIQKPKLFFFQVSAAIEIANKARSSLRTDASAFVPPFTLPAETNILVFRSTYEQGPDHRPKENGSWVIQRLAEKLEQLNGTVELMEFLPSLIHEIKCDRTDPLRGQNKKLPEVTSTLIEPVFLKNIHQTNDDFQINYYAKYKEIGKMYVFNYSTVWDETIQNFLPRDGSQVDVTKIKERFEKIGFSVKIYDDRSRKDIFKIINEEKGFYNNYACVVIAVLTHGIKGNLGTVDSPISEAELFSKFSETERPDLIGKPKLFFFQVCRGNQTSEVVGTNLPAAAALPILNENSLTRDADASAMNRDKNAPLLEEEDYLVFHSTYPGAQAHVDSQFGSWFFQDFCDILESEKGEFSLTRVLGMVQNKVAKRISSIDGQYCKQMPVINSTLTKSVMLKIE